MERRGGSLAAAVPNSYNFETRSSNMNEMMQEMSGRPSPTPTFAPTTNQPVDIEAPPIASSSEPALSETAVVIVAVLAGVALCGVVSFIVFRKYRPFRSHRELKRETEDAKNPSASRVVVNSGTGGCRKGLERHDFLHCIDSLLGKTVVQMMLLQVYLN